ncbi:GNAT family N-acetyltransferase [Candidatus Clostridium stratigraminis]|uniref:GNAT family N-acetyltransferase n=1 Tax=Candidatus Clostridium stratigraminis TaxID=3381661 RepID=A0ABW8TA23_9CLOT
MRDEVICLKKYINEEDYKKINELKNLCSDGDINLKLELDYKLNIKKEYNIPLEDMNEFLYYADDDLIGYLGICCFGGNTAELTGMVHPKWRRKNIFTKLYKLAIEECKKLKAEKILLVCDNKSSSGLEFIKSLGAEYSFSEYGMKLENNNAIEEKAFVNLRKALNSDGKEISRQNSIYFSSQGEKEVFPEEEEKYNSITYMIELKGRIIGKIRTDLNGNSAFIYGFGILPEYRGQGYGRETLETTLVLLKKHEITTVGLEVAAENSRALNLYKSCGFVEENVMDYFKVK